ncbi:myrosinase 1-like isoform X6 [Maniola jurtina]|uniref:myrosinase 1-like isoform X6 n=1 Tax=Maniola jurtina TaxID=191418 RepID=UPI001E687C29|nr:myrosinase 1-like isoform X6 [Maniola jurtina]
MWLPKTLVFSVLLGVACCNRNFPPGFKFGAATAAYQVEGAWNVSDKSESIWDVFTHEHPEAIIDRSTGDVACDSYHQWQRDVEIASELGLHFYRFSIAWTRLLPNGFSNYVSEDGKKYYSDLIDGLLEKGIEPVVVLYHFDLPQSLQNLGGWTNPLIADWFGEYARVAFSLYGNRVKTWLTINEPIIYCQVSYGSGMHAPGIASPAFGGLMCSKNAVLAHAKAWRIYDEEFRQKYQGKVSLTNQLMWFEPDDENEQESADLAQQLWGGVYTHPVFSKDGGWPPELEKKIAEKSRQLGYTGSKLPPFTQEEKELVRGTYDFFGFNFYTARTVRRAKAGEEVGPWPFTGCPDLDFILSVRPDWKPGATRWFFSYPRALRLQLSKVKQQYGDIDIFILENGVAGYDTDLDDQDRINFYRDHLEQVLLSINEDGVKIVGYTAWTMIDNYEWSDGYRSKFGLYEVDFSDPQRTRRPRASAQYYARVIQQHSLDVLDTNKLTDELYWTFVLISPIFKIP